jgi:acetolactate synthase-1/2/3 large subunit
MRFSDRVATNIKDFAPHATIIQIDIDESEIRKNILVDMAVVGDIKSELNALLPLADGAERPNWLKAVAKWKEQDAGINSFPSEAIRPRDIMEVIGEVCGEQAIIATDVGQHQMWASQYCKRTAPRGFLTSGGLGTMGFGYGAAIGAQVGEPDKRVIHITSDGSFHMNMNEAVTAVSYDLPVITVILDNRVLGMVYQWQTSFYEKHYIATTPERQTDYLTVAKGFGAGGYRAGTKAEFEAALVSALAENRPCWIVCPIDRSEKVLPMIASGETIRDVITD